MDRPKRILFFLSFASFLLAGAIDELGFHRYPPGVRNADGSVSRHDASFAGGCARFRAIALFGDRYAREVWRACDADLRRAGTRGGFDLRFFPLIGASGAGALFLVAFALALRLEQAPARIVRGRRYLKGGAARAALKAASRAERRRFGKGLEFPRGIAMSLERETRHFLVWGSVGAGKTQAMLHLMRAALDRGDKLLVLDTKGDMTASLPDPILIAPQDARSSIWNVAADCRTKQDARELAARLIPASADPMWSDAAREVLVACLAHLQATKPGAWTWEDLRTIAVKDAAALFEIARRVHPEAMRLLADPQSRTTHSVLATLSAHMNVVGALADAWPDDARELGGANAPAGAPDDPSTAPSTPPALPANDTNAEDADETAKDERTTDEARGTQGEAERRARFSIVDWLHFEEPARPLILQRDGKYPELSNAWIGGLLGLLASAVGSPSLSESSSRRLWLFLDEFPQLPRMGEFTTFMDVGRSKGVVVVLGAQDIAQIRAIYGRERADSWIGLVGTQIITRLNPGRGAEEASLIIGDQETEKRVRSVTTVGTSSTVTESLHREMRRAVTAAELSTRLGPRRRGVRVLFLGPGADAYEIDLPYLRLPQLRPSSVPSSWTHCAPRIVPATPLAATEERSRAALSHAAAARIRELGR